MLCLCVEAFHPDHIEDEGLPMKTFINKLCEFDNEIIPKSYPTPMKPWFSDECRQAILACKISLRTFKRFSSDALLQGYCIKRAKEIRQVICADDQSSWREYVSTLNARTPIERKLVHGLQFKKHSEKNGQKITVPRGIANTTGEVIFHNSSSIYYSTKFQHI